MLRQSLKKRNFAKKLRMLKSPTKETNPRVPYLALPPELGNEDRRDIHQRRLGSYPSCPCWTWEDTRRA